MTPHVAFAVFYGAVFLALGILIPFWPVWLGHRGLSGEEIGLLLAAAAWIKIPAIPLLAYFADRSGRPKAVMLLLAALACISFAVFPLASGLLALLSVQLAFAFLFNPLIPLGESQAMAAVRAQGLDYGRMRLWGSLTFIAGSFGAGLAVSGRDPGLVHGLALAALAATLLAAFLLPAPARPPNTPRPHKADLRRLLANRRFLLFLGAACLLQASHAAYYGFSSLHWRAAGYSESAIGLLWAEGVAAEILLFLAGARLVARLAPSGLLLAAALAGVLRWSLTALSLDPAVLVVAQCLHALTFGAAHLGAMHFIARTAPAGLSATAQGLYAALSGGLVMGLASLLAGRLYDSASGAAFGAMAAMCAVAFSFALALRQADARSSTEFPG